VTTGRLRGLVQNLGLLAAASIVAVVGAEWLLRTWAPQAGFVYRLDPRCLYTLAPGARKVYRNSERNGGRRVLFVVNSDGFRGDALRRDPGLRVLVYGDSFVEADYAPLPETFTSRLQTRLASALARDVEAVNAGVNGYGPDQALRRFEDEAGRLRPAVAIVVVYAGNDFGDVLRNRLYRLEGGRLVGGGGFVAESLWWQFEDARQRTPYHLLRGLRRLRNAHRRAAATAELPEQLARYVTRSLEMCEEDYRRIVVQGERAVDSVFRDPYDADLALLPDSPAAAYKRDLLEAVLGLWRQAAAAARVPILVVVVPPAIDCDAFDVRVDRVAYPGYDPARLSRTAAEAARRQGLGVLELREAFRANGAEGLYQHREDDHWNTRGQDLAARLVTERLVAEGWLSSSRPAGAAGR
jgi:lysophospholipase L1-like esterase